MVTKQRLKRQRQEEFKAAPSQAIRLSQWQVAPMVFPKIAEIAFERLRNQLGTEKFLELTVPEIVELAQADVRGWYVHPHLVN